MKAIIIYRPGSVTTPCCTLKTASVLISSLAPYTWPFSLLPIDARSLAARALSPPQQQQQQQFVAASASSFECRRHGLLVVLLVLCDTRSVAALLLV